MKNKLGLLVVFIGLIIIINIYFLRDSDSRKKTTEPDNIQQVTTAIDEKEQNKPETLTAKEKATTDQDKSVSSVEKQTTSNSQSKDKPLSSELDQIEIAMEDHMKNDKETTEQKVAGTEKPENTENLNESASSEEKQTISDSQSKDEPLSSESEPIVTENNVKELSTKITAYVELFNRTDRAVDSWRRYTRLILKKV